MLHGPSGHIQNQPQGYSPHVAKRTRLQKPRPKQGAHLLALRKRAGLTQVELAAAAGVPQTTIALWERSDIPPRSDALPKLAKALGVKLEHLLADTNAEEPLANRPGPVGEVQRAFEEVRKLPRNQQRKVIDTVIALVEQYKRRTA